MFSFRGATNTLVLSLTLFASGASHALVEMGEEEMQGVSGAGLAVALDNFSVRFAPTSFIELTGSNASAGWNRGDGRYYGLSITNGAQTGGTDWYGNGCSTGGVAGALACPIGNSNATTSGVTANPFGVGGLASVYDPYVLRVFEYEGYDYQGNYLTGTDRPTILELIGPSNTDTWRWSFWGELEVDRVVGDPSADIGASNCSFGGANCGDFLQSQTIIRGKPVTLDGKPARLRLMRTVNSADPTLGIAYQSALSGDFRFSVRQNINSEDSLHYVPDFQDNEGLFFKNVDAYLPLGTLHYQAITLDALRDGSNNATGDFIIELTQIPNIPQIYNNFYCGDLNNTGNCALAADGSILNPNEDTQGYVRWGDFTGVNTATGAGLPTATNTTNGIFFVGGTAGCNATSTCNSAAITNIGISRIEGMRIHHLKITTLGASGP